MTKVVFTEEDYEKLEIILETLNSIFCEEEIIGDVWISLETLANWLFHHRLKSITCDRVYDEGEEDKTYLGKVKISKRFFKLKKEDLKNEEIYSIKKVASEDEEDDEDCDFSGFDHFDIKVNLKRVLKNE